MPLESGKIRTALIPLLGCAVLLWFRLHAFDLPLETDEANYAYIGARLLDGDRLYVDVWDHQPPGVFMLFAAAISLFGDSPNVFRWMAAAFSIASLALLYAILQRISGRAAAILGVILFSVVSSDPGTGGEGLNREIYMNTLVLAAWWFALLAWRPDCDIAPLATQSRTSPPPDCAELPAFRGNMAMAAAGLCLGLASLLKTNVAVYWFFLAAWIIAMACLRSPGRRATSAVGAMAVFSVGPILVWTCTLAYFAATGRFRDFMDAVFLVNLDYADTQSDFGRFATFFDPPRFQHVFDSAFPLWIGAATGFAWLLSAAVLRMNAAMFLIIGLVAASFLAVCLPGRFWPHYYYLMIPPAVIVMTLFIVSLLHASAQFIARRTLASSVAIVASGLIIAVLFASEYEHFLSKDGLEITLPRYNTRDYWGRAQGENVARVTSPGDSVFVYGNDAAIYYYSGRKCASRYTMITGLHPQMRGAEERRRRLMSDLRASRPRVIVVVFDQEPFAEWKAFLEEQYGQPAGWDFHDERGNPIMFVLARKDAPIPEIDWNWDRAQAKSKTKITSENN